MSLRRLRYLILIVASAETAIWLKYLWLAVADSDHMTRTLQRDFAILITAVYAATAGPALVLALLDRRLGLALVLAILPIVGLTVLMIILAPGG